MNLIIPSFFAILTILGASILASMHPLNNWLSWAWCPAGIIVFALAFWAMNRTARAK